MIGWDVNMDLMSGNEEFGNANGNDNAWGKKFNDQEFTIFKVETLDGSESREYKKEEFINCLKEYVLVLEKIAK